MSQKLLPINNFRHHSFPYSIYALTLTEVVKGKTNKISKTKQLSESQD